MVNKVYPFFYLAGHEQSTFIHGSVAVRRSVSLNIEGWAWYGMSDLPENNRAMKKDFMEGGWKNTRKAVLFARDDNKERKDCFGVQVN